jgi:CRP-like cAMP-binding protein
MDSSKSNFVKTLRRRPLFTDLSEAELALIAESVSRLYFDEGSVIFGEGDVCRELLIVEEGTVKIVKSALNGRQQLQSEDLQGGRYRRAPGIVGRSVPSAPGVGWTRHL